jgi:hypothetical protein
MSLTEAEIQNDSQLIRKCMETPNEPCICGYHDDEEKRVVRFPKGGSYSEPGHPEAVVE